MRPVVFLVPGRIDTPTGGYIYDRRIAEGLRALGWSVSVRELDGSFPFPTGAALDSAAEVLGAIDDDAIVIVDGLAFSTMPQVLTREASRLRIVALVHLPVAADVALDRAIAAQLEASERTALATASLVVVTGAATLLMLDRYAIPPGRIAVVEPGTDPSPIAHGSAGESLHLLSVATINAGKGHDILLQALADVPQRNWRLTCAGSLMRDPATVDRVRKNVHTLRLEDRVSFVGEVDPATVSACYDRADLFVLATLQETYGMAVAEALAHGLPVVSTTTGSIPALVGQDAGVLVSPGDSRALTAALAGVLGNPELRGRLAEGARRVRNLLPTWEYASKNMSTALDRVGNHA
jgi:glycosyltransferase involved in cell wall biosynthesis